MLKWIGKWQIWCNQNKWHKSKLMTLEIFNVVRSTHTPQGHAQRIQILVTSKKKSNTSTINLNNKKLSFDLRNFFVSWLLIFFSENPSTCVDRQLLDFLQNFRSIFSERCWFFILKNPNDSSPKEHSHSYPST